MNRYPKGAGETRRPIRSPLRALVEAEVRSQVALAVRLKEAGLGAPLLTAADVAALLGVSTRHVHALASEGRLVRIKFGSATRFTAAGVRALIEEGARRGRGGWRHG